LKAVNLWYAHSRSWSWLLTRVPVGVLAYWMRGWPTFEQGVSCFIKDTDKVLDLGGLDDSCTTWWPLVKNCIASRLPPATPANFAAVLRTKKFTNGADCTMVEGIYADTFKEVLGALTILDFASVGWGAEEVATLASALPACHVLSVLDLESNEFGEVGATALARALPVCSTLETLRVSFCGLGDEESGLIFDAAAKCPNMRVIQIAVNPAITPEGVCKIAAVCPSIPKLTDLFLGHTTLGEQGAAAVARMIPQCASLVSLFLDDCVLPEESKNHIRAAWADAGKNPGNLFF